MVQRFGFSVLESTPRETLRRSRCVLDVTVPRFQALTNHVGLLPSGRDAETLSTSKRRRPSRCHHRPTPTHLELDVRREPDGIHHEQPRSGQIASGGYPFRFVVQGTYTLASYLMSPKVSTTFILAT